MRRLGKTRRTIRTVRTSGRALAAAGGAVLAVLTALPAQAHTRAPAPPHWALKDTGAPAVRFRGLAAVDRDTAWVAGTRGTVLRTVDGGGSWRDVSPPGAADLQFRDVEAFDARHAVVLAIGEGEASRVYRTEDGGTTWTESFRNTDARAFYDCMTFFDRRHGLAVSDPVDGRFRILSTSDGGRSWKVLPDHGMPAAQEARPGFAASGQCLVASGPKDVWLATGGAARARVLRSSDRGLHLEGRRRADPGGRLRARSLRRRLPRPCPRPRRRRRLPSRSAVPAGRRHDRGRRPRLAARRLAPAGLPLRRRLDPAQPLRGARGRPDRHRPDHRRGRTWRTVDTGSYDTVDCVSDGGCWAAGEQGRVARLER